MSPVGLNECYETCLRGVKDTNKHHLAFERRQYKSPTEKAYRESACMKVAACVCKHVELHAMYLPPQKPDIHTMHDVIQGDVAPIEAPVFIRPRNDDNLEAL